jgi:hypothetical protein
MSPCEQNDGKIGRIHASAAIPFIEMERAWPSEDTTTPPGMDLWVAVPDQAQRLTAEQVVRFASLTDCAAEPSGIYFDTNGKTLFINVLHRGGPDPRDLGVAITRARDQP